MFADEQSRQTSSRSVGRDPEGAEMVSHPTFQESWGMLVEMNFKVGDKMPRRRVELVTQLTDPGRIIEARDLDGSLLGFRQNY